MSFITIDRSTIARYENFFRCAPIQDLNEETLDPGCFPVVQYWTDGKLGLLFDLHSGGIFTKANMQTEERNFEKRIAWATLGVLGCNIADLPFSDVMFELPTFEVGEIHSYLHVVQMSKIRLDGSAFGYSVN